MWRSRRCKMSVISAIAGATLVFYSGGGDLRIKNFSNYAACNNAKTALWGAAGGSSELLDRIQCFRNGIPTTPTKLTYLSFASDLYIHVFLSPGDCELARTYIGHAAGAD